ncbi:CynX/NimT family MFS transporter [Micromonospora musae]|uniref:CynX/NimT family MFS transporter n=1 Tax=Micromonospora musae TaxID=1894970 RepID=UPI003F4DCFFD
MTPPPPPTSTAEPTVVPADTAPAGPRSTPTRPSGPVAGAALVLVGMLLVALNLRAAITSLGALLDEVRDGMGLSGAMAGVITTLPAIAFGVFGALTPRLVRRYSPPRLLAAAMVLLAAGQLVRVGTTSTVVFLVGSATALAGVAVANVLLPLLVKQYFPHRIGLVTGAYSMTLTAGAATAAATTVPIAHLLGSWRAGLAVWAGLAAVAVLPWLPLALRRGTTRRAAATTTEPTPARIRPARTRLGWAMAVYFGTQSLSAYAIMGWLAQLFRDAGFQPEQAGLLLAGVTALGVPIALLMPTFAGRLRSLRPLMLALSAAMAIAYVGVALAPHRGALLWVVLLAIGQSAFPLALAIIGMRARTTEGTVALSAFTQSTGYLIAAIGPLLVGILYQATGGWTVPIGFLAVALVVQTAAGMIIARPRHVEDER